MLTYLFDASAAVELYAPRNERTRKTLEFIAEQRRTYRKAVLLIPNFCIVEVFNALAKKYFAEHSLAKDDYAKCLKRFRQDIHWGKPCMRTSLADTMCWLPTRSSPSNTRLPWSTNATT